MKMCSAKTACKQKIPSILRVQPHDIPVCCFLFQNKNAENSLHYTVHPRDKLLPFKRPTVTSLWLEAMDLFLVLNL